jgi:formate/nitrite transporter
MDYIKPLDVIKTMVAAGSAKGALSVKDLLIRGFLSGALLGYATSLAFLAAGQTGYPLVGALVFPVGFVMIVLLGLELATGSFALLPLAWKEGQLGTGKMMANLGWVLLGNLLGSIFYGALLAGALTTMGHSPDATGIAAKLIAVAQAKTIGYAKFGAAGMATVFVKAILCNWMVCLGVVMGMTSQSTIGKIAAAWLPIFIFFAHGFEHSIVNMFVIPTGMMLGAKVNVADWWLWNQIPVTLGNIVGGYLFTGFALYLTHGPKPALAPIAVATETVGGKLEIAS